MFCASSTVVLIFLDFLLKSVISTAQKHGGKHDYASRLCIFPNDKHVLSTPVLRPCLGVTVRIPLGFINSTFPGDPSFHFLFAASSSSRVGV